MKSSSALFPVALMRAEVLSSNLIEDTYLLKPNNSPDLTAQIALSRLGFIDQEKTNRGTPVVLIHGLYSNRSSWLDENLNGFASLLLKEGLDPWMLELRGHGDSPVNAQYQKNNIELYAKYDLQAVQQFIQEQTSNNAIWIGHGVGGVVIATAFAEGTLNSDNTKAIGLFNAQVSSYSLTHYLPFIRTVKKIKSTFKSIHSNKRIGPEVEPKGIIKEQLRWSGLFTRWKPAKGTSFWKKTFNKDIPLIAFIGKKDKSNPSNACKKLALNLSEKPEIILLAKSTGYTKDYQYFDTIQGQDALKEVWPILNNWIKSLTA